MHLCNSVGDQTVALRFLYVQDALREIFTIATSHSTIDKIDWSREPHPSQLLQQMRAVQAATAVTKPLPPAPAVTSTSSGSAKGSESNQSSESGKRGSKSSPHRKGTQADGSSASSSSSGRKDKERRRKAHSDHSSASSRSSSPAEERIKPKRKLDRNRSTRKRSPSPAKGDEAKRSASSKRRPHKSAGSPTKETESKSAVVPTTTAASTVLTRDQVASLIEKHITSMIDQAPFSSPERACAPPEGTIQIPGAFRSVCGLSAALLPMLAPYDIVCLLNLSLT